jgi:hypothetical protein
MPIPLAIAPDQANAVPTLATNVNLLVTVATATRANTLREFQFSAEGTASAAQEIIVSRVSTAGTTPAGAITARPLNTSYTAGMSGLASRIGTTAAFAAEAAVLTGTLLRFGLNANGALFRWVAAPGLGIDTLGGGVVAANQLSFYAKSGSVATAFYTIFDEL